MSEPRVGKTRGMADGGHPGTGTVILHRRERGQAELAGWKQEHDKSHKQVRARAAPEATRRSFTGQTSGERFAEDRQAGQMEHECDPAEPEEDEARAQGDFEEPRARSCSSTATFDGSCGS